MKFVASSRIDGEIEAPASKSMTVRALAAASLVDGETGIENPSACQDALHARKLIEALGSQVEETRTGLIVRGGGTRKSKHLDCGESGLSLRMFSAIAALSGQTLTLHAKGSLRNRPMGMIPGPLKDLGAWCQATNGLAPLKVRGPLRGGSATVDANETSQALSGLLLACPLAAEECELKVLGLKSSPYVAMTIELLEEFGISWGHDEEFSHFHVASPMSYRSDVTHRVEGDWSGAASLLVLGAMTGRVSISGLRLDSLQADKAVLDALRLAGASVVDEGRRVVVSRGKLRGFEFDITRCPDLAPSLAVLGCACEGQSIIRGADRLRNKESDRASVLVEQLTKMGAHMMLDGNSLVVAGGGPLACELADPYGDHRMAMAFAVAAVGTGGSVGIDDPACVAKSYPEFFRDLERLGAEVR